MHCTGSNSQLPHPTTNMESLPVNGLTIQDLLKTLSKEQKKNWPLYLLSLIFAYNATLFSTTVFQSYKPMVGHKAPTLCSAWLVLSNYNDQFPQRKCTLINEQCDLILSANRHVLRQIKRLLNKVLSKQRETCQNTCREFGVTEGSCGRS